MSRSQVIQLQSIFFLLSFGQVQALILQLASRFLHNQVKGSCLVHFKHVYFHFCRAAETAELKNGSMFLSKIYRVSYYCPVPPSVITVAMHE